LFTLRTFVKDNQDVKRKHERGKNAYLFLNVINVMFCGATGAAILNVSHILVSLRLFRLKVINSKSQHNQAHGIK